ncbi:endonuclease domain-containing protein [Knoellia subterranea]|uniref:endonuclease domain-containing protein n=1 Tax=Knoellia subterranea TaxID=184882 RepID=UPI00068FAD77|nr:type IV toxin-antitoxin system AbiEi family antitoxin domain-containing protein [Knoellia subterranea]
MSTLTGPLAALAAEHHGLVTAELTRARHISPSVVAAALRSEALHRIRPGIFVDHGVWEATQTSDKYTLLVRGVMLGHPHWLASHHAGLALLGLPLFGLDLSLVDVVAAVRTSKRRPGLHVHVATAEQRSLITDPTITSISAADACVLTAADHGLVSGVVAMDAALKRGMTTATALTSALESSHTRYGAGQARAAIAAIDPLCESPGETRTRLILMAAGLDVRSQVSLKDARGFIGRVDFLVGDRVVVEFDGAVKYEGLEGKRALMEEKQREERLRDAGFRVVRLTWADLSRPDRVVARVRAQLAAA